MTHEEKVILHNLVDLLNKIETHAAVGIAERNTAYNIKNILNLIRDSSEFIKAKSLVRYGGTDTFNKY